MCISKGLTVYSCHISMGSELRASGALAKLAYGGKVPLIICLPYNVLFFTQVRLLLLL